MFVEDGLAGLACPGVGGEGRRSGESIGGTGGLGLGLGSRLNGIITQLTWIPNPTPHYVMTSWGYATESSPLMSPSAVEQPNEASW